MDGDGDPRCSLHPRPRDQETEENQEWRDQMRRREIDERDQPQPQAPPPAYIQPLYHRRYEILAHKRRGDLEREKEAREALARLRPSSSRQTGFSAPAATATRVQQSVLYSDHPRRSRRSSPNKLPVDEHAGEVSSREFEALTLAQSPPTLDSAHRCEDEEMEHLNEPAPASAQALQQPDVDTTLEDSQPTSFMEVYDAAYAHKCEEQQPVRGTASAKPLWHFPKGFECLYPGLSAHDADIIRGAHVQKVAVTSPASGRCLFSSSIRLRRERDWGLRFYMRVDLLGSYHTYPCVGGPFQCLQEANDAIDRYLKDHQDPTVCLEPNEIPLVGKARVDYEVRRCIFWPDGTRKRRLISEPVDERRCWMDQLVKALVDKYNEDYNLVEGDAYEYKAIVHYNIFWEGDDRYYHINFLAKTKEADDSGPGHLFFAEVTHIPGEHDNMVVTCISIINRSDEGRCYRCEIGMKHPSTAAYFGGHLDGGYDPFPCFPIAGPFEEWKGTDDDAKAEEDRLRQLFAPSDPSVLEQLMKPYVKSEDGSWILPDSVKFELIY